MVFSQCPACNFVWPTREDFLADHGVCLVGYRISFVDLMAGVFLFRHRCEGLLTMHAGEFADLYHGPIFEEPMTGTDGCPGYCLRKDELRPCPAKCECAYVREIMRIVKEWPKREKADGELIVRLGLSV